MRDFTHAVGEKHGWPWLEEAWECANGSIQCCGQHGSDYEPEGKGCCCFHDSEFKLGSSASGTSGEGALAVIFGIEPAPHAKMLLIHGRRCPWRTCVQGEQSSHQWVERLSPHPNPSRAGSRCERWPPRALLVDAGGSIALSAGGRWLEHSPLNRRSAYSRRVLRLVRKPFRRGPLVMPRAGSPNEFRLSTSTPKNRGRLPAGNRSARDTFSGVKRGGAR